MRLIICLLGLTLTTACAQKNTGQVAEKPAHASQSEQVKPATASQPCPKGVKTGCNVPAKTSAQLQKSAQDRQACISKCIKSRQAEAISHELIESQCQIGCNRQHPLHQVRVIPTIEELQAQPKTIQERQPIPEANQ